MITIEDYLWFVDDALAGMVVFVEELGDDLANTALDVPGANSPFAVLTHCLGVLEHWGGEVVAGRSIRRDRDAEFRARGRVIDLVAQVHAARSQLAADLARLRPFATAPGPVDFADARSPAARTQGGVLMHIFDELAQHRGQMAVTRDALLSQARPGA